MTWDFRTTFDALAAPEPVAAEPPTVPLYGSDLQCASDLEGDMAERDGSDPLVVVERFVRMLSTPRGSLVDAPGEGIDLRGWLSRGLTQQGVSDLKSIIQAQAEEDDRIASVSVTVSPSTDGSELEIQITGSLADSSQTFALVMGLTDSELLLQEMTLS